MRIEYTPQVLAFLRRSGAGTSPRPGSEHKASAGWPRRHQALERRPCWILASPGEGLSRDLLAGGWGYLLRVCESALDHL